MKIIYYLKNLKINEGLIKFIGSKIDKIKKIYSKENEGLAEIEIFKDRQTINHQGFYKTKFMLKFPSKPLIIAKGVGKSLMQSVNKAFERLFRQIKK